MQDEIAEAVTLQEKGHTTSGLCSKSVRSEENCVAIPYLQCTFSSVHEIKKLFYGGELDRQVVTAIASNATDVL